MKVIIDRFEGEFGIVELEDKRRINMPRELIPQGAGEGDVLDISLDIEETKARRKRMGDLMDDLWT